MKKSLINKQIIFSILLGSFILTGCQNQSLEDVKMSNDNKEVCRYWIESGKKTYQKKANVWKNKLDECQSQLAGKIIFNENDNEKRGESVFYNSNKGSGFNIEMERYKNKMYGYTIEVPKSWGAIFPMANIFTDNLYEEMETIGPYLKSREAWREYLGIEVFGDGRINVKRTLKEYGSWFDFYESSWLKNKKYTSSEEGVNKEGCKLKKYVELSENGEYLRTYKLIENKNRLYVFSYDKDNGIHENIIDSIELN